MFLQSWTGKPATVDSVDRFYKNALGFGILLYCLVGFVMQVQVWSKMNFIRKNYALVRVQKASPDKSNITYVGQGLKFDTFSQEPELFVYYVPTDPKIHLQATVDQQYTTSQMLLGMNTVGAFLAFYILYTRPAHAK
jgi:hypothetical protein